MDTNSSFVKRNALLIFFTLAYGFSWGSFFLLDGPSFFPIGALIAAFIVAGLTGGLKDLLRRMFRWQVGIQWYVAAFLVPVTIALAAVFLNVLMGASMSAGSQAWYSLFLLIPTVLIDAPFWEETGWRGFAMPRFSTNRSALFNTIILGVLLAGWHLPIALSESAITVPYVIGAFSSVFATNWIYYNTRGSALLPMLYHTAANTIGPYFFRMFSGSEQVSYFWFLSGMTLVAGIILVLITGPTFQRRGSTLVESAPVA